MPFIKKNTTQSSPASTPARSIFVGRANELVFFTQQILKPEEPAYNLLSIWGQGGVGKTTLLQQFKNQATTAAFKAFCLTAMVDERQETPARIMERFAQQLHLGSTFEKALNRYKEALQFLPSSRSSQALHERLVTRVPDLAGAVVEGMIPIAGPVLGEGVKATTEHLLDLHQPPNEHAKGVPFHDPLDSLTQVFVSELNHLAATKVALPSNRTKRERRILLFFDTFEQVADEVVPWLLSVVLGREINSNIVFIFAGRDPLERSTAAGPKQWLPYYESQTLHALPVQPFTQEETFAYLAERGITAKEQMEIIWRLSHGLPLYLGLLTSTQPESLDPTKDVVDNFLQRIPDSEPTKRQLALDAALFSRPFNLDDLEAFPSLSEGERPALYAWLLRQPFVRASSLSGRYVYHDLVQELFQQYVLQHSPKTYYATRRLLATYYQQVLEHLQTVQEKNRYGPSPERLEVMLALASQRLFLPDEESHFQALLPLLDIWEYEKFEQRDMMLRMLQRTTQILSHRQASSHAYQVAHVFLRFLETVPTQWDQTRKQAWPAATDQLLKVIKHTSSPELLAHIYHDCGWGHIRLRKFQQALTWFERALPFHPHSARIQNGLGHAHYYLKEYQQALDHFNHGLELAPHHPHLYDGRGKTYGRLGAYQQAVSDFSHAIQLDGDLLATNQRGRIYLELKDYRKALADWDHWLEAAPEHPRAGAIQFQQGCAYLWLKDLPQATTCFTRSYELASTRDSFSWAQDSVLWAREWSTMCQAPPGPHTIRNLAVIAEGSHYTASVCRGVIFFLQKEYLQALTALQHATTLHYDIDWYRDPWADYWREWDAPFWLAMTYFALDQEEEARMALEQALAFQMPPILLKPLCWFEREKPKLSEQLVKPLFATYEV
jgi:tetratricopeptide (TPR) repeat protein